jgi:hypothetical protein
VRWISSSDLPRKELRIHDGVRRDLLLVAAVGLYAVMAYSLAQWQQELGIRIALGASARDVTRLTLGDALKLSGMGAVIGAALSIGSNRLIEAGHLGVAPGRLRRARFCRHPGGVGPRRRVLPGTAGRGDGSARRAASAITTALRRHQRSVVLRAGVTFTSKSPFTS